VLNRTTTTTTTTTITTMTGRDLTCALLLENRPQVIAFVDGLFVNCQDLTAFKVHLRDFLVQTKVRHHDRQPFSLSFSLVHPLTQLRRVRGAGVWNGQR